MRTGIHDFTRRCALLMVGVTGFLAATGCQTATLASTDNRPAVVKIEEDFRLDQPSEAWAFRTPALWRIAVESDRHLLQMAVPPPRPTMPGVRRPQEYALYQAYEFRSFNLSVRVRIDCDVSVKGRDACIIFGRRDNTHLYYAHLSNLSQEVHNNVVRVDGLTRQILIPKAKQPPPTIVDKEWHKVDVLRDCDTGSIKVYVDAYDPADKPVFDVNDKTYEWGCIGLASFDDHASFAHLLIEGQGRKPQMAVVTDPP